MHNLIKMTGEYPNTSKPSARKNNLATLSDYWFFLFGMSILLLSTFSDLSKKSNTVSTEIIKQEQLSAIPATAIIPISSTENEEF